MHTYQNKHLFGSILNYLCLSTCEILIKEQRQQFMALTPSQTSSSREHTSSESQHPALDPRRCLFIQHPKHCLPGTTPKLPSAQSYPNGRLLLPHAQDTISPLPTWQMPPLYPPKSHVPVPPNTNRHQQRLNHVHFCVNSDNWELRRNSQDSAGASRRSYDGPPPRIPSAARPDTEGQDDHLPCGSSSSYTAHFPASASRA